MGSEATDGKTRFRGFGAANDSQKSNKRGPRERGRRGNAGKWAPAPLEAAGGAPPPREIVEDACVEQGIRSTGPSGRRNEAVDRAPAAVRNWHG